MPHFIYFTTTDFIFDYADDTAEHIYCLQYLILTATPTSML